MVSYVITGVIAFVAVKKLRLPERRLADIPWRDVIGVTGWVLALPILAAGVVLAFLRGQFVIASVIMIVTGAAVLLDRLRVKG